ncbi:hypothetical protein A7982_12671 [Minicystis rosea]|nr:hypothetical protein A7982_12671 [Minicystis rosea]
MKIVFKSKAYAFPPVCACCLAPTQRTETGTSTRTIGIPMVAAVKKTFSYEYPFCEACAGIKRRFHTESGYSGCLPGIAAIIGLAVGKLAGLRGAAWTACIVAAALGLVLSVVLLNVHGRRARTKVLADNPGHPRYCTGLDPVDLCAWETIDSAVFEIKNPDFARAVVESGRATYQQEGAAKGA